MQRFSKRLACLVFALCVAIAGIGPDNEVRELLGLLTGGPSMQKEHVLCMVLLVTFLIQDFVPLDLEKRLAHLLFGPDLFGLLLVVLFCLFDTSVDLYDFIGNGEFSRRVPDQKTEKLLISATNLVLVIAHIKTYKMRYAFHLLLEERRQMQETLDAKAAVEARSARDFAKPFEMQDRDAHPAADSSVLLGRPQDGKPRHVQHEKEC